MRWGALPTPRLPALPDRRLLLACGCRCRCEKARRRKYEVSWQPNILIFNTGNILRLDWYEGVKFMRPDTITGQSGSWDIIDCPGNITQIEKVGQAPQTMMIYTITIRRKTLFYTVNLIIPVLLWMKRPEHIKREENDNWRMDRMTDRVQRRRNRRRSQSASPTRLAQLRGRHWRRPGFSALTMTTT
uniref:Neur_chan_LBD domain-containing protein n=1 Tax=Macrostomum lignano TaxID=282301 RepID=A0A1I8FCS0_9PLAT